MLLVWLVLTNGNIPAIVTALLCLQTMKFFQRTGFGESKAYSGGTNHCPYMMGLGQGNRAAPPLWIQLSAVLLNVLKQLELGALLLDPITLEMIHRMGALFVEDTDIYMGRVRLLNPGDLWRQIQVDLHQRSCLLNATGGALKPENVSGTCLTLCVSLPKKSTYVQKPTYASLANFSEGEFKSPHGRFSVTKPT